MGIVAIDDIGGVRTMLHIIAAGKQSVVAAHNIGNDGLNGLVVLAVSPQQSAEFVISVVGVVFWG